MKKTVLVLSTLDTKGEETLYLAQKLEESGLEVLVMNLSMGGRPDEKILEAFGQDRILTPAKAGGVTAADGANEGRSRLTDRMIHEACGLAKKLHEGSGVHGVVGLGGSTGSLMATEVMRALPFGIPKLMISSTAALPGLSTRYIGTGDITLFHSVVEISGVTDVLRNVLDRGAHALAGMVLGATTSPRAPQGGKKALALTMLGPCEKCASAVRKALEREGYQVIGFSAAGIGDRAMEEMIAQGFFQGVVDLAPGGVGEHHFGFMRDAGPHRLETAGRVGIPQVVSTCSVNHMTPAKSRYKPEYHERRKYDLDKYRTWIRMSPTELKEPPGGRSKW